MRFEDKVYQKNVKQLEDIKEKQMKNQLPKREWWEF